VTDAPDDLPIQQARSGSAAAWDILFKRYQLPLYAYVCELVRDREASLDIVQETFVNAVRHLGTLREDGRFGGWLFGIAHQKCIQRWRSQAREEIVLGEVAEETATDYAEDPAGLLIRAEQEAEFMELLNALPLPQRSVLLLHFIEGFSIDEIAGITGAQPGTVKSRMHYAKKALRVLIEAKP
jgi:RNA polymerase sigma-70 factor (ECF subfamily)